MSISDINNIVQQSVAFLPALKAEIQRVIVGQTEMIHRTLIALLAGGHILLEGAPGLAKTLLCNTLAKVIDAQFQRIQFTPDLLPADLIGTLTYQQNTGSFAVKQGPIFANIVLADEINRAPAKVQSALLEAMQERQVTIGNDTYTLPKPFFVMATQNPIEQEGTYALPEAQVDRFMMKVLVDYPTIEEEKRILDRMTAKEQPNPKTIVSIADLIAAQSLVSSVFIDECIKDYIVNLVYATRKPENYALNDLKSCIEFGASPRATIFLTKAAKANAILNARAYVMPEDVREVGFDVLRHRITLSYEAEADSVTVQEILNRIFSSICIP